MRPVGITPSAWNVVASGNRRSATGVGDAEKFHGAVRANEDAHLCPPTRLHHEILATAHADEDAQLPLLSPLRKNLREPRNSKDKALRLNRFLEGVARDVVARGGRWSVLEPEGAGARYADRVGETGIAL